MLQLFLAFPVIEINIGFTIILQLKLILSFETGLFSCPIMESVLAINMKYYSDFCQNISVFSIVLSKFSA